MTVLLDTHALIWALEGGARLPRLARSVLEDVRNLVLVSVVCAWEIEIKRALGQLDVPGDLESAVEDAGFLQRLVTFSDVRALGALPVHHRDPFDRMLVAQAMSDDVPLVTADPQIAPLPRANAVAIAFEGG